MSFNFSNIPQKFLELLNKYFKYFAIVFAVIVLFFGYLVVLKPKWDEVNKTGIFDFNNETNKLENSKDYLARLNASLEKYKNLNQSDVEKLAKIIPSEDGITDLFVIFEELVRKNGLKLDSIDISKEGTQRATIAQKTTSSSTNSVATETKAQDAEKGPASKNIHILDIAISVSGAKEYSDLKKILSSFENELRIMDVDSISFGVLQSDTEGSESGATYSFNITTYYYSEGEEA